MTILDALKSHVKYPLGNDLFSVILITRALKGDDYFDSGVAKSFSFLGARADCYKELVVSPDISQGGISISAGEKERIITIANDMYKTIGETIIGEFEQPTITPIYE